MTSQKARPTGPPDRFISTGSRPSFLASMSGLSSSFGTQGLHCGPIFDACAQRAFALPFAAFSESIAPLLGYERQTELFRSRFADVATASYDDSNDRLIPAFCLIAGIPELPPTTVRRNVTPDARLVYWMAERNRAGLTGRQEVKQRREFIESQISRDLFKDYGSASFQPSSSCPIPADFAPLAAITAAFQGIGRKSIFSFLRR